LTRNGAQEGDQLLVTGNLGGSILSHHYEFTPRLDEIATLASLHPINAAIDISDGLGLDLSRLAESSQLAARIDPAAVPISAAAHDLSERHATGKSALQHALRDGEDFELLLAVSPEVASELLRDQPIRCGITLIGEFFVGEGLFTRLNDGSLRPFEAQGYVHGKKG
jgi:thiamine-monophosphate kinase